VKRFSLGFGLLVLCSCAGQKETPVGFTRVPDAPATGELAPRTKPKAEPPPDDIVERSALPLRGVRLADNTSLDQRRLFDELSRYDAVCVGEAHDDPHHHFAELVTLEELERRARHSGEALGVGFEMFQAPYQGYLDAFSRGRLDEAGLLSKSEYEERWGFPFAYYRPLLETARSAGLPLLALNARRELTREVAQRGLALPPELERELPALELYDATHRALFDELIAGHPTGQGSPDNLYAAQVVWDETMAARASEFLVGFRPARKLLVIAGVAHCSDPAIPARIERRTGLKVASVRVSVGAPEDTRYYDYAIVLERE
jgi:uncharacterized iron-regulated protein